MAFAQTCTNAMSLAGATSSDAEAVFLAQLPTIDRVLGVLARRHTLSTIDSQEFASWALTRLIENDYAILRKFEGRSSMATYLSVVLSRLSLDYRNSMWGRWRPSAMAVRLGDIGVRIEEMLHRDGHSLREIIEVLRTSGSSLSDIEIGRIARQLPHRAPSAEVSLTAIEGTAREADPASIEFTNLSEEYALLRSAISDLSDEDQVIVRMRFWHDVSVADIARALRIEQKPLYRRIEQIGSRLRSSLADRGLDRERAQDVLAQVTAW
jgi:RNA polymerase sigma factor (sigma-70 family)